MGSPTKYQPAIRSTSSASQGSEFVGDSRRKGNHIYIISGVRSFVRKICAYKNVDHNKVIACFEQNSEQDGKIGSYQWDESLKMYKTLGFSPMTMADMQSGQGHKLEVSLWIWE